MVRVCVCVWGGVYLHTSVSTFHLTPTSYAITFAVHAATPSPSSPVLVRLLRSERPFPLRCRTSFVYLDHLCAVPLFFYFYTFTGLSSAGSWLSSGGVVCWSLFACGTVSFACFICRVFVVAVSLPMTRRLSFGLFGFDDEDYTGGGTQRINRSEMYLKSEETSVQISGNLLLCTAEKEQKGSAERETETSIITCAVAVPPRPPALPHFHLL